LDILPPTSEDSPSLLLPDQRKFLIQGKVVLCFHVAETSLLRSALLFGKYAYEAAFFVPAEADICAFDAYIGADIIDRYHVQGSYFFSSSASGLNRGGPSTHGLTPMVINPNIRTADQRALDHAQQRTARENGQSAQTKKKSTQQEQPMGVSTSDSIEMSNRQTDAQNTSTSRRVQDPSRGTVAEPTEE
jgi:hypothetical protein